MGPAAGRAYPVDQEAVAGGSKPMLQADRVAEPEDLVVAELDDPVADRAVQVVVRRITIVVLERAAIGQPEFTQQAGLDQEPQSAIDGRAADVVAGVMEVPGLLIGRKMLVRIGVV